MNRKFFIVTVALLFAALASSACLPGFYPSGNPNTGDQAATQQAYILQAVQATATTMSMQTQIAVLQTQIAQGGGPQQPQTTVVAGENTENTATFTPTPTATPTATATATVTATSTSIPPTDTPVPPTATFTVTPLPCDMATFVQDVTIPDGTVISPGATFSKTWRLKNVGACTWTTNFDVVFVNGTQMANAGVVDLPGNVTYGQVIDITVTMVAPSNPGTYRSEWKLRDASGVLFGVGKSSSPFYAEIKVAQASSSAPMDFITRMCDATWTDHSNTLPCPGNNNDSRGFVLRVDNPTLESGYVDNEPVLQMYPQMITDGNIRGKYPAVHVESGYHFQSTIGCAFKANSCNVTFRLDYQIGNNTPKTLKTWHEVYDEKIAPVDVDLSGLAGQDVKFILTILANGPSTDDRAQWLMPRIVKK